MKKDIKIPEVKDVYIVVVKDKIKEADTYEWSVYVINNSASNLETVIIVSEGFSETKKTSTLRKKIDLLPKKSFAKIEIIQEELFGFSNQYKVSYFKDNQLFDKTFVFKPNSIKSENHKSIPLIEREGILAT